MALIISFKKTPKRVSKTEVSIIRMNTEYNNKIFFLHT